MREASSGDQTACRLLGAIDGRQYAPCRAALIDERIIDEIFAGLLLGGMRESCAIMNGLIRQGIDGRCFGQYSQMGLLDEPHASFVSISNLHQARAHSRITNFSCKACSLMVSPKPGRFSSNSTNPSLALGSP